MWRAVFFRLRLHHRGSAISHDTCSPVVTAILLTFVLAPAVAWFQRFVRNRVLAVACVIVAVVTVAGLGAFGVGHQFVSIASELPTYHDTIARKVRAVRDSTRGVVSSAAESLRSIGNGLPETPSTDQPSSPVSIQPPNTTRSVVTGGSTTAPAAAATGEGAPSQDLISAIVGMVRPLSSPIASALFVILLLTRMLHSRKAIGDRVIGLASTA